MLGMICMKWLEVLTYHWRITKKISNQIWNIGRNLVVKVNVEAIITVLGWVDCHAPILQMAWNYECLCVAYNAPISVLCQSCCKYHIFRCSLAPFAAELKCLCWCLASWWIELLDEHTIAILAHLQLAFLPELECPFHLVSLSGKADGCMETINTHGDWGKSQGTNCLPQPRIVQLWDISHSIGDNLESWDVQQESAGQAAHGKSLPPAGPTYDKQSQ